jgi:hypothetical protein
LAAGTVAGAGFLVVVVAAGAGVFALAVVATGCFSAAFTTPVWGAGAVFAATWETAGAVACAGVAAGLAAALAMGATDGAAAPAAFVVAAVQGADLAAAGVALLCPKSEVILLIAEVVFETASLAAAGTQG